MGSHHLTGIVVAALLAPPIVGQEPPALAPGQVWQSAAVFGEREVCFVVLALGELPDIGPVVGVRLSGFPATIPAGIREVVERQRVAVYPTPILTRHATALLTTLPRDLFGPFDLEQHVATAPGEPITTVAPSQVVERVRGQAAEFSKSEDGIPVRLPATDRGTATPGTRITVAIVTVKPGRRQGIKLIGHQVAYRVGGKDCADLDAIERELKAWRRQQFGEFTVHVAPLRGTVYGDVADVVARISAAGFDDIHFAAAEKAEPQPVEGQVVAPEGISRPVVLIPSTQKLAAGQVWSYRVPQGEKPGTLIVQYVADVAGHGKVAFVEFEGPPVVGEPPIAGASQTRWIPIWQRSLVRHLDRKVDTRGVAAEHEQVRWWLEQFGKGLAGYVTVPPSRIARDLRAVAERDRLDPPVEGAKKE